MPRHVMSSTGKRTALVGVATVATALFSMSAFAAGNFPNEQDWNLVNRVFEAAVAEQQKGAFGQAVPSSFVPAPVAPAKPAATGYVATAATQVPAADGESMIGDATSAGDRGGVWRVEIGNEDRGVLADLYDPIFEPIFGNNPTDGGMTWAGRVSYTPNSSNPDWFQWLRPFLIWTDQRSPVKVSYSVEMEALTPNSTAKARGEAARPHAGHLAFDARVAVAEPLSGRQQQIEQYDFVVGLVGPASGAQLVHNEFHDIISTETDPWDEIKSELILNLNYEYGRRFFLLEPRNPVNVEFHPYAGVALGNALTYGSLGLSLRFGGNLDRDLGAPRQRLLLSGENFAEPGDYWVWNVSLGMEGRAMAHSVFINGNAFRDTASVDSKDFVYDVQLGFEVGYGANRLSIMNVYRSREFKGQKRATEFIRMAASTSF